MKICYVFANYYLSHITGQAGLMNKLAIEAAKNQHEVSVISNDITQREFNEHNVRYVLHKGKGDYVTYIANLFPILFHIQRLKPDVLHVHGVLYTIYICFINMLTGIPLYVTLTETLDQFDPWTLKLLIFCLNRTRGIFVTNNYLKKQLIERGINANKITVIRIGLDDRFITSKTYKEKDYLLFFGDAKKERGFDHILSLARYLPEQKFLVLLRFFDRTNPMIKSMQKLHNVKILYFPYKQSLISLICQAKLVLLPFRWMSIRPPISILEAMALGKCVITSRMPGNEELMVNGKNGYMCDFDNIDATVTLIKQIAADDKTRQDKGRKAKENIVQLYSIREYSKIFETYRKL